MSLRIFFALPAVTIFVAGASASPPPAAVSVGYSQPVFVEEFNDLDVSSDGRGQHRWYNGLWYHPPAGRAQFSVKDGHLHLIAPASPVNGTSSTTLTTWPRGPGSKPTLFRYGYFEARIRFTPGRFNWPALWLVSANRPALGGGNAIGSWCEIDIFEGGRADDYWGTVHGWHDIHSDENANQHHKPHPGTNYENWNVVGALWQQGKITWYLNGRAVGSAPSPKACDNQDAFLIISAQKRRLGFTEQAVEFDWVRVFR